MSKSREDARSSLLESLALLRGVSMEADLIGTPHIGVFSLNSNGTGMVLARIDLTAFLNDLAIALNAPVETDLDRATITYFRTLSEFNVENEMPN